jgi:hypothetical protein
MNMYDQNFNPYDTLINLTNRVSILEQNQQEIIKGLQHSQETINTVLHSVRQLQAFTIGVNEQVKEIRSEHGQT